MCYCVGMNIKMINPITHYEDKESEIIEIFWKKTSINNGIDRRICYIHNTFVMKVEYNRKGYHLTCHSHTPT